jgi:hypothetical protein
LIEKKGKEEFKRIVEEINQSNEPNEHSSKRGDPSMNDKR